MAKEKKVLKQISYDDGLRALALVTMAEQHAKKATELEHSLSELLGFKDHYDMGWMGEAIWGERAFADALKLEGFTIAPKPKKKAGRK